MAVLESVFDVFAAVVTWMLSAITSLIPMFYVEGTGLTFIGVLTVAALAISVCLLLIRVISNFLQFRA